MTQRSTALVIDSGAALDERLDQGLAVVPLHVQVGSDVLDRDGADEVYRRLRLGEPATTSTPSPGDYVAAFDRLLAHGHTSIVCLAIPGRWSGMYASASIAAAMFRDAHQSARVDVVETTTAAAGFGLVARVAAAHCAAGAGRDAVLARVASAGEEVGMFGALSTLEFVARSGRVPSLVAGVSDALRVRPVFEMQRSGTGRVGLARTDAGVLRTLERVAVDRFGPPTPLWALVFHAGSPAVAEQIASRLGLACNLVRCECVALDPVIGVHTGPGAVGFAALPLRPGDPGLP